MSKLFQSLSPYEYVALLMPHAAWVLHTDLVTKQDLGSTAFPASVAGGREHKAARRVDVDRRDHTAAVAGDDGEGYRAVAGGFGLIDVVDAEDVV